MIVFILLLLVAETALTAYGVVHLVQLPDVLPVPKSLRLYHAIATTEEYVSHSPEKLLELIGKRGSAQQQMKGGNLQSLRLVYCTTKGAQQVSLLRTINAYLVRCHFTQPDISWLRSTVDRRIAQYELPLRYALAVPLLIGVLARLIYTREEEVLMMWTLGLGLLFTSVLVFLYVLGARQLAERKNALSDFLQNEVQLPQHAGLNDNLSLLRNELHQFSKELAKRVSELLQANQDQLTKIRGVQEQQVEAINRETVMLDKISKTDFVQVVRFNTDVLNQLKATITDFGLFTHLASSLGGLLGTMERLTVSVEQGVERTKGIEQIAAGIQHTVQRNNQLQDFLSSNVQSLADRRELIQKTVGGIDAQLTRSIDEMRQHIQVQVDAVRKITLREHEQIEEAIRAGRLRLEKMDRLDEVAKEMLHVRTLNESMKPLLEQIVLQLTQLNGETVKLRTTMEKRRLL